MTGGALRGRRLRVPAGGVRPTADRVREALFARLGALEGVVVLDLYSGSGALAIESLSRGADSVVCVERAPRSLAALRENVATLDLATRVEVVRGDAVRVVARLGREGRRFDLALLDPPYASDELERALAALQRAAILPAGATLVIERGWRHSLPETEGFELVDERRYGETVISRLTPVSAGDEGPGAGAAAGGGAPDTGGERGGAGPA